MTDPDRTMMGRSLAVPRLDKMARIDREAIAAVGIANFQNGAGHAFSFGAKQGKPTLPLHYGE